MSLPQIEATLRDAEPVAPDAGALAGAEVHPHPRLAAGSHSVGGTDAWRPAAVGKRPGRASSTSAASPCARRWKRCAPTASSKAATARAGSCAAFARCKISAGCRASAKCSRRWACGRGPRCSILRNVRRPRRWRARSGCRERQPSGADRPAADRRRTGDVLRPQLLPARCRPPPAGTGPRRAGHFRAAGARARNPARLCGRDDRDRARRGRSGAAAGHSRRRLRSSR